MRAWVSVSRSMKAALAPLAAGFGDILGIGGENRGRMGADRALHGLQRLIFLLGRASASTRAAARARAARSVIRAGRSALPSIAFSGAVMAVPAFR